MISQTSVTRYSRQSRKSREMLSNILKRKEFKLEIDGLFREEGTGTWNL